MTDHPEPKPPLRWNELVTCEHNAQPHSHISTCKNARRAAARKANT